jgi:hypothetical protein
MSERTKALLAEVLALPDDERAAVADGLWASLSEAHRDEVLAEHGPMADPDFRTELARRSDAVHDRPEELIDGEEAFRQIRAKLTEARTEPSR